jgi:predicted kinase
MALAHRFGFAHVDVDDTKQELFGSSVIDANLSHSDWNRVYSATDKLIESHLRDGKSVVDASRNFKKHERKAARRTAESLGAEMVTILVDTAEAIARRRLLENRQTKLRRDVSDQDFEQILTGIERPSNDEFPLVFREDDRIDSWIANNTATFGIDSDLGS